MPSTRLASILPILAVSLLAASSSSVWCADTTPPSVPQGLKAEVFARNIRLTWTASTDDAGVAEYRISRNGTQIASTPDTQFVDFPAPWGACEYVVRAVDASGNTSGASASVTASGVSWMWPRPANWTNAHSGRRHHVFYEGETVRFDLETAPRAGWPLVASEAVRYEVRDYWGELQDSGQASSSITVSVDEPGWYKLYLYGAQDQFPWGEALGGTNFVLFRDTAGFPKLPLAREPRAQGADQLYVGSTSQNAPLRGLLGSGPCRLFVNNASNPDEEIARLEKDVAADEEWYLPHDPLRQRKLLVAFPNGTSDLAGVRKIVEHFKDRVKYWEPRNEPNDGTSGSQFALEEMKPFYETVKSVSPDLQVMGPGTVSIGGGLHGYLRDFFNAGAGEWMDVFSFHAYNNVEGDLWLARKSLDELEKLLGEYGLQDIEKWQTEQGYFAPVYGSYQPRLQGRWTMLQMMVFEQYGIPKEHNYYWYERSHGFWDFPTFLENDDGSLNPGAALLRVWAEELYGTTFSRAFDFGAARNNIYIGNLFEGPGKRIAAFMTAGTTDGHLRLQISEGNSVKVVSSFGVEEERPIVDGVVELDVPEIPVYVELSPDQQIQVEVEDWGPNLARLPGVTLTSSGSGVHPVNPSIPNSITKLVNGIQETSRWQVGGAGRPWMDDTDGFSAWVQIDLPIKRTIDKVVIYAFPPWQWEGTLTDYELQYEHDGHWVTIDRIQEPTNTFRVFSPQVKCTVDSFFSDRWILEHNFEPVETEKLRILVHDCTWGGGATRDVVDAGGQTGPHKVVLREIELYDVTSPRLQISGQIVDAGGRPVAGVPVALTGAEVRKSTTDNSGRYSFDDLVAGCYYEVKAPSSGAGSTFSPKSFTVDRLQHDAQADFVALPLPSPAGTGLLGTYHNSTELDTIVGSRIDPRISFDWQRSYPFSGINTLGYSVSWQGQVQPRFSETYTFTTRNYDGVRLWVDGCQLVNHWGREGLLARSGQVALEGGRLYDIRLDYSVFGAGLSFIQLLWSSPSQPEEIIPTAQLYPYNPDEWNHPFNFAPTAQEVSLALEGGEAAAVTLLATDPEGAALTYSVVSQPAHGTLSGTAPDLTYTPAAGYSGTDSFTFKANDGAQDSNVATVEISVAHVNQAPVAENAAVSVEHNRTATVNLTASDPDGDALSYILVAQPQHGTLSGTGGSRVYAPQSGYSGADSFTFKVNDSKLDSNVATVTLQVAPASAIPLLTLTAQGMPVDPQPGDEVHLTVNYANSTQQILQDVVLTYPVPVHADFVLNSASAGGTYHAGDGVVRWTLGQLAPGASGSVSFDIVIR